MPALSLLSTRAESDREIDREHDRLCRGGPLGFFAGWPSGCPPLLFIIVMMVSGGGEQRRSVPPLCARAFRGAISPGAIAAQCACYCGLALGVSLASMLLAEVLIHGYIASSFNRAFRLFRISLLTRYWRWADLPLRTFLFDLPLFPNIAFAEPDYTP
jgi:hypothetical protein